MNIPPLNLNSTATSALSENGAYFSASGPGDWNVNLGSAGQSVNSPKTPVLLYLALGLGAMWLLLKK